MKKLLLIGLCLCLTGCGAARKDEKEVADIQEEDAETRNEVVLAEPVIQAEEVIVEESEDEDLSEVNEKEVELIDEAETVSDLTTESKLKPNPAPKPEPIVVPPKAAVAPEENSEPTEMAVMSETEQGFHDYLAAELQTAVLAYKNTLTYDSYMETMARTYAESQTYDVNGLIVYGSSTKITGQEALNAMLVDWSETFTHNWQYVGCAVYVKNQMYIYLLVLG